MQSLSKYAPYALAVLCNRPALHRARHRDTLRLSAMPGPGHAGGLSPLMLIGALLEVFGDLAILVGFFTRHVAFILSGEMAVAYWAMHVPMGGFFPLSNGGDAAVLYCFIFLYLVFAGPGAWSVDGRTGSSQPAQ